jgi:transcriptional regulator with XRE-family HTH domain
MVNIKENETLKNLGKRLKNARLELNDPQKEFAFRIGVSIPTLYKMEQGNPSVSIGTWMKALSMLGKLDDFEKLIAPNESLFERYDALEKTKNRQRVRRQK